MSSLWARPIAVAGLVIALVGFAPAHADTGTLIDPRGDVRPAALDWTRLTVNNSTGTITARVKFVNLPQRGKRTKAGWRTFAVRVTLRSNDPDAPRAYTVLAERNRTKKTYLSLWAGEPGTEQVPCRTTKVRWVAGKGGSVEFQVPRTCVDLTRSVVVSAKSNYAGTRSHDSARGSMQVGLN